MHITGWFGHSTEPRIITVVAFARALQGALQAREERRRRPTQVRDRATDAGLDPATVDELIELLALAAIVVTPTETIDFVRNPNADRFIGSTPAAHVIVTGDQDLLPLGRVAPDQDPDTARVARRNPGVHLTPATDARPAMGGSGPGGIDLLDRWLAWAQRSHRGVRQARPDHPPPP